MRGLITAAWVVAAAVVFGGFVCPPARAAAEKEKPVGRISVQTEAKDEKLKGAPIMVSILADGKIVGQWEMKLGGSENSYALPVGTYDVRVEGEGCVTLVKRGITLTDGDHPVLCPISSGKGVHVVEYAAGGLSREEAADRIAKLEAAVARLEAEAKKSKSGSARDEK